MGVWNRNIIQEEVDRRNNRLLIFFNMIRDWDFPEPVIDLILRTMDQYWYTYNGMAFFGLQYLKAPSGIEPGDFSSIVDVEPDPIFYEEMKELFLKAIEQIDDTLRNQDKS